MLPMRVKQKVKNDATAGFAAGAVLKLFVDAQNPVVFNVKTNQTFCL